MRHHGFDYFGPSDKRLLAMGCTGIKRKKIYINPIVKFTDDNKKYLDCDTLEVESNKKNIIGTYGLHRMVEKELYENKRIKFHKLKYFRPYKLIRKKIKYEYTDIIERINFIINL